MAILSTINPVANSDFTITLTALPNVYWTTFSGIKTTYKRPTYNDGLSQVERTAGGGTKANTNITISKPYDPESDDAINSFLVDHEEGDVFDMSITPIKRSSTGEVQGRGTKSWKLTGCRIASSELMASVDTGDGSKTVVTTLEFSYESATFA
ncbi:hypothetical protein [Nostoc sp. 'Peltigera membranacea cyanobiont' N6]|uniref:hypothetical protein n=1 Tax=Nostoc sp. 'Peltigera membranacea cyanobiont' N6 TaxID=1261031 RepID=UPI000CF35093|nr:hypothetical protein [Nostoc sp. 'Peltigera membranacea cyanobiont' N6]AVH67033.1 hypothetical protein NPM_5601 [Nostoc sp. 'Peltigera membranacea cyanobiont' N6]